MNAAQTPAGAPGPTSASPSASPALVSPSLKANPLLSDWLCFRADGHIEAHTGKVELGQGIRHALHWLVAQSLGVEPRWVRLASTSTAHSPDEGMTAGSLSVQDSGRALRLACAQARALLSPQDAERQPHAYVALAGRDLALPIDSTLALVPVAPMPETWPREDLRRLLQAEPHFIHDLQLPGLLHAHMVRPAALAGAWDWSAWPQASASAAALPGVRQLLRDGDLLAVLADSDWQARRAAERLARHLPEVPQALTDDGPKPDPAWPQAPGPCETEVVLDTGTPAPAPHGATRLQASYFRPALHHASIGLSCALARWSEDGRQLEVWCHSQGIHPLRRDLASALDLPPAQITVHHVPGAGCYGHNGADDVAFDAAWAARHVPGMPVRVVWSRRDEMIKSPLGPAMRIDLAATLGPDGQLLDWQHTVWSQGHSTRPGRPGVVSLQGRWQTADARPRPEPVNMPLAAGGGAQRNATSPYRSAAQRVVSQQLLGRALRPSSLRGLGAHANVFARESFVDELALAAGQDPLAWRLDHLDDARARAVLQRVAELSGWSERRAALGGGQGQGLGVAQARYKDKGAWCAVVAEVDVAEVVRVARLWVVADIGQVIHPGGARLQLEGGAIQSTSWALKECVLQGPHGLESVDWETYPILRFSEVPDLEVDLIDAPDQPSLGAGEAAQGPTTAAIANAVAHALGVRVRQLPLTPEQITAAM